MLKSQAHKLTTVSKVAIIRHALGEDKQALGCLDALMDDFHSYQKLWFKLEMGGENVD